ncbi:hypothetical protein vseg_006493 [Gypsophila vaccaria]
MAVAEEAILSRIDRLDHLLRNMEEVRVGNKSPRSSSPSTPTSSGTRTSEYSPRSRDEKYYHYRSIEEAIMEMEHKGSLLDRVAHMEDRLLKVCKQVEEELDVEKHHTHERGDNLVGDHKGLKQLIKSCVKGKSKGSPKPKSKSKSKSTRN